MIKNYLIVFLILVSVAIVGMGLMQSNVLWILSGCAMMLLSYTILKKLREREEIDYARVYEKKIEAPTKKIKLKYIILAMIGIISLLIGINVLKNTFATGSYFDVQAAINEGCRQLEPNKLCRKDPSTIIIPFDVNNDGLVGGVNDTFSALMESQNCTGDCIKTRCSCPQ